MKWKETNLAVESGVQANQRSHFPFVYISISTSKRPIGLFIRFVVLVMEHSTKLSSRSALVFLKALVDANEHDVSSQSRVSLVSCLHSRCLTSLSVSDHSDDFEDARDLNTFLTRARKLSSTDSKDTIEGEGEGYFLRFSFCVYYVFK